MDLLRTVRDSSRTIAWSTFRRVLPGSSCRYKACLIHPSTRNPSTLLPRAPPSSFRNMTMMTQQGPEAAHRLLSFVNASPTPFHAVTAASAILEKAGFSKVNNSGVRDNRPSCLTQSHLDSRAGRLGEGPAAQWKVLLHPVRPPSCRCVA